MTLNEDDRRWCRALGHTPESRAIKEHLNALDLSEEQRERIVDEANVVFRLNIEVFNELEGSALGSALRLALSTLKEKLFG